MSFRALWSPEDHSTASLVANPNKLGAWDFWTRPDLVSSSLYSIHLFDYPPAHPPIGLPSGVGSQIRRRMVVKVPGQTCFREQSTTTRGSPPLWASRGLLQQCRQPSAHSRPPLKGSPPPGRPPLSSSQSHTAPPLQWNSTLGDDNGQIKYMELLIYKLKVL